MKYLTLLCLLSSQIMALSAKDILKKQYHTCIFSPVSEGQSIGCSKKEEGDIDFIYTFKSDSEYTQSLAIMKADRRYFQSMKVETDEGTTYVFNQKDEKEIKY